MQNVYDITIFTIYGGGELQKELQEFNIEIKTLFKKPMLSYNKYTQKFMVIFFNLFMKEIYIYNMKNIYDVEIAFLEGPVTRLLSYNSNAKKIAWVHTDMKQYYMHTKNAKLKLQADKIIYNKYDEIVFVSKDTLSKFEEVFVENQKSKQVIYNYIDSKRIIKKSKESIVLEIEENIPSLVTVARLTASKGLSRFLDIHKKLLDASIIHRVYIIGDGEEKSNLNQKIAEMGMEKSFILLGKKENPYPYILKGNYFCLFSEFEGYGIVLDEAKVLSKPILITDTGAREAAENYAKATIFANDEEAIYKGLSDILKGKINKKNKGQKTEDFNITNTRKIYSIIELIDN